MNGLNKQEVQETILIGIITTDGQPKKANQISVTVYLMKKAMPGNMTPLPIRIIFIILPKNNPT